MTTIRFLALITFFAGISLQLMAQEQEVENKPSKYALGINFATIIIQNPVVPFQLILKKSTRLGNFRTGFNAHYYDCTTYNPFVTLNDSMRIGSSTTEYQKRWAPFIGYEVYMGKGKFKGRMGADFSAGYGERSKKVNRLYQNLNDPHPIPLIQIGGVEFLSEVKGLEIGISPFIGFAYDLSPKISLNSAFYSYWSYNNKKSEIFTAITNETSTNSYSTMDLNLGPLVSEISLFYKF